MLASLFAKTLRDQRLSLLGWSIGLAALSLYLLYVYPFMNRAGELLKLRRGRVVMEKSAAHALALFILALVFWTSLAGGTGIFHIAVSGWRLAEVIFSCFLLGMAFFTIALAIGCLSGKKKLSVGISGGLAIVTYLINAYAPMVEVLRPYRVFSPFYYYNGNTVLINGLDFSHLLVLSGLIALFFGAALFSFSRRELAS
ncbi:MAG: hypothetical protein NTW95_05240 [Candidatus Aminicenantes bacterium]|nr:hypothetical protein [Candidatus Aminicenantes bacterium]